ncbi:antitoxin MazE [Pelagirhabdus alkalitolerans]|uniref:Antitoxin MazE n=1 Tax=Pelagirhabdus alkalitolerans TaxID=1612202 RepID=A0A1G6MYI0_9BACI|nr:AbrB/MazE/SpoVT family DNA-binding domain-containing protein [Pelagirhabdus alkalitolerans]SDC60294.1 antitoxin MazE [Pelagirhabdus alkalitolerans]
MNTEVKKWGNSLAIRIPQQIAKELNIDIGTEIDMTLHDDELTIKVKQQDETLEDLIAQITTENQHDPVDFGQPSGRETI